VRHLHPSAWKPFQWFLSLPGHSGHGGGQLPVYQRNVLAGQIVNPRIKLYYGNFQPVLDMNQVPVEQINAIQVLDTNGVLVGQASKVNSLWSYVDRRSGYGGTVGDSRTPAHISLGLIITELSKML
jgi:hypothetical protein